MEKQVEALESKQVVKTAPGTGVMGKRHRKPLRDNILGITKPAIRRMARRGGVKRMTDSTHPAIRAALIVYLENVIGNAVVLTEYRRSKTVTAGDVAYALRSTGTPLYGTPGSGGAIGTHKRKRAGKSAAKESVDDESVKDESAEEE